MKTPFVNGFLGHCLIPVYKAANSSKKEFLDAQDYPGNDSANPGDLYWDGCTAQKRYRQVDFLNSICVNFNFIRTELTLPGLFPAHFDPAHWFRGAGRHKTSRRSSRITPSCSGGSGLPVSGTAKDGEIVTVTLNGPKAIATARRENGWSGSSPMKEVEPFTLTIAAEKTICLTNIFLGKIWLCSGQSNMQWPLAERTMPTDSSQVRKTKACISPPGAHWRRRPRPVNNFAGAHRKRATRIASTDNFMRSPIISGINLREALQIHAGLIPLFLRGLYCPGVDGGPIYRIRSRLESLSGESTEWAQGRQNSFSLLYHAMIAPIVPYENAPSMIWFQGEGNFPSPPEPDPLLRTFLPLIDSRRAGQLGGRIVLPVSFCSTASVGS